MPKTPALYALLIGIDDYHPDGGLRNLRGCVNDVQALAQILRDKFNVPAKNIVTLTNKRAKAAAIQRAFRKHLLGNGERWAAKGRKEPPPAFLFHFSGHGSQARDESGTEPDGMDETLVPYDSRTPGIYDLRDWELGGWLAELNTYSDNVTVILDCCHSGSGTRALDDTIALTRRCPPDPRPQPTSRPAQPHPAQTRGLSGSHWGLRGKHVLLAGCRASEEANEYGIDEAGSRRWQGALTYFLIQELAQLPPDQTLRYAELHGRVRIQVANHYPHQTPQCEGEVDRVLFGGLRPAPAMTYHIQLRRNNWYWIDGGLIHGLRVGSQLYVYANQAARAASQPLATLELDECRAGESRGQVIDGVTDLPILAPVALHRLNLGTWQRTIHLDIADAPLRTAVEERLAPQTALAADDVSNFIKIVDRTAAADYRLVQHDSQLLLQDGSGAQLVAPYAQTDLETLAADLVRLVRYANIRTLRNDATQSVLAGKITLGVKQIVAFDPLTERPTLADLPQRPGGETVIEVGTTVAFAISNRSNEALYFALLGFAADWEIYQLYPPKGAREPIAPGVTFTFYNTRQQPLKAQLPQGHSREAKDFFKVIATKADTNFSVLEQSPLVSPFGTRRAGGTSALDQLLAQVANGGNTRAYAVSVATPVADEWTTAELDVLTVAKK